MAVRLSELLGDAVFEVELNSIACGIGDEDLRLCTARHIGATIGNAKGSQATLDRRHVPAGKRDVVEGPDLGVTCLRSGGIINEMQHRLLADVEPVATKVERGSLSDPESDHLNVEGAKLLKEPSLSSKIEVIESDDRH